MLDLLELNRTAGPDLPENKSKNQLNAGAHLVAVGILLSRISGLIRQRIFAHFFGSSDAGDAFYAALKIPNFLQNLFGEGVLSASFIPVYSQLLGKNEEEHANEVAGIVGSLLFVISSVLVLLGVLATPYLIDLIAPGFTGEKRLLTIRIVRILFPGTGLMVMSAWCLGILNSHRKFFLSYAAPVIWNFTIIGAMLLFSHSSMDQLACTTAWGLVAGSLLQFGIQLPTTLRLLKKLHIGISLKLPAVRQVLHGFVPVVIARGVVQLSAYIDNVLASFLPMGAVSALAYAQSIYLLPISLFGMSISAAQLPSMSRAQGTKEEISDFLRKSVVHGLNQVAFFIVPSVMGFWLLGDVVVQVLYQSGKFGHADSIYVWGVLIGSTVGLLASTQGRLYSSTYYSLQDTRTPLNFALIRVTLTTILGYVCGLKVPGWFGVDPKWGAVGLTASAGLSGWVEYLMLRHGIDGKIGKTRLNLNFLVQIWAVALASGLLARSVKWAIGEGHPLVFGTIVLTVFIVLYMGITAMIGMDQSKRIFKRAAGILGRK
ncbi:MAG: murein biosynthesis integral membrane protein MurJ [Bdellovibrionota bacterium]